jgi:hypothetical protein
VGAYRRRPWWSRRLGQAVVRSLSCFLCRGAISARVFEVVPGSYLGCPVEYRCDLECFGHAKTILFHMVTLILSVTFKLKTPFPPLAMSSSRTVGNSYLSVSIRRETADARQTPSPED